MSDTKARAAGPVRPRVPYSEAVGQAICSSIALGQSLAAISRRKGMPPRSTVEHWLKVRPDFAEAFARAVAAAGGRRRGGRPNEYSLERAAAFCARLGAGEALHRICAEPGMPSQTTVYLWLDRHPEFEAMYLDAREIQAQRLFDEVREIADTATPASLQVDRTRIAARQWQAARLAPRKEARGAATGADLERPVHVEIVRFFDDEEEDDQAGGGRPH